MNPLQCRMPLAVKMAVWLLLNLGILALGGDPAVIKSLKGQKALTVAPVGSSTDGSVIVTMQNKTKVTLSWLAVGVERNWTLTGSSRPNPSPSRARPA